MAFSRVLNIFVTLIVVVLTISNAIVSVYNARGYFSSQMDVLAQDAATSLGLTLSSMAPEKDMALINGTIDAIFDSGYYRSIVYTDVNAEPLVSRVSPIDIEGVPQWFVTQMNLPVVYGRADVVSGWLQLGKVHITPHPGYAYRELWRVLRYQTFASLVVLCAAYLCFGLGIRWLTKSLEAVTEYASHIAKGEFPKTLALPVLREMRLLTQAMNEMKERIQRLLQEQINRANKLQQELTQDRLTGLINREEFDSQVSSWLAEAPPNSCGILILLHIENVQNLNNKEGREAGDQLICQFSSTLCELAQAWRPSWVGRRSGADFSVYIPGVFSVDITKITQHFYQRLQLKLQPFGQNLRMGVSFASASHNLVKVLVAADDALRRTSHERPWVMTDVNLASGKKSLYSGKEWLNLLNNVLAEASLGMQFQPMMNRLNECIGYEALACIDQQDGRINARGFWSLAERHGLSTSLDKLALQSVMATLQQHPDLLFSVNISAASLTDLAFKEWLKSLLSQAGNLVENLCFEISLEFFDLDNANTQLLLQTILSAGSRLALQSFGATASSLPSLKKLPLAYVKLEGTLVRKAISDAGTRFYIASLVQIVHECDVIMVATSVADEQLWQLVRELGVDAGQGYYLGSLQQLK